MEMHQVRYFLAVVQTGNFTRAAEECHVSQPSLTRAIKTLEGEFGNGLFHRERPGVVLTELGERVHPILKQCFESALRARSVAKALKKGERGSLKLALSHSVAPGQITAYLAELRRVSESIDVKLMRGTAGETLDMLKRGHAELAVASTIDETWERFERWPLFEEGFDLFAHRDHPLANRVAIDIADVRRVPVLRRTYCEHMNAVAAILEDEAERLGDYEVGCEADMVALLEGNLGVAVAPSSTTVSAPIVRVPIRCLALRRTVYLYAVSGCQRSLAASALVRMLRSRAAHRGNALTGQSIIVSHGLARAVTPKPELERANA
jgi:DNA-binding transcriptional LysR family regulator